MVKRPICPFFFPSIQAKCNTHAALWQNPCKLPGCKSWICQLISKMPFLLVVGDSWSASGEAHRWLVTLFIQQHTSKSSEVFRSLRGSTMWSLQDGTRKGGEVSKQLILKKCFCGEMNICDNINLTATKLNRV